MCYAPERSDEGNQESQNRSSSAIHSRIIEKQRLLRDAMAFFREVRGARFVRTILCLQLRSRACICYGLSPRRRQPSVRLSPPACSNAGRPCISHHGATASILTRLQLLLRKSRSTCRHDCEAEGSCRRTKRALRL